MNREHFPAPNAECVICSKKYYRCARCIELKNRGIEAWKLNCDTFDCFNVHCLIENAKKGNFNKNNLEELLNASLPDDRQFNEKTLNSIEEIKAKYGNDDGENFNNAKTIEGNVSTENTHERIAKNKRLRTQGKVKNVK